MTFKLRLLSVLCLSLSVLAGCNSTHQTLSDQTAGVVQTTDPQVGVQLYSVKDQLKADFEGTLTQIAQMGFKGVEFAGVFGPYGDDPQGLKALLDKLGLKVSGAHVKFSHFEGDKFDKTVNFYKTLDTPMLIVPWDDRSIDPQKIDEMAADFVSLAKRLEPYGIQTGYHNHDDEFAAFKGTTFWDYLAKNTPEDIVLQLDVGWVTYAGKDPVDYVKRYPGRTLTTHYKAKLPKGTVGKKPIIGQDSIRWKELIETNKAIGGTLWLVIEQEEYPDGMTQLEAVRASKKGLDEVLKTIN